METTGLSSKDEIIEIACVRVHDLHFTTINPAETFHTYVKPTVESGEAALKVHGITTEFLKDKPEFASICDSFLEFISDSVIIAHNAQFDISFINRALAKSDRPALTNRIIDSLTVARRIFVGQAVGLDRLPKLLGIEFKRGLHSALEDAMILAKVYAAMMKPQLQGINFSENQEKSTRVYQMRQTIIE